MPLSEALAPKFRADIRFRGEAYVRSGRVAIEQASSDRIEAAVDDGVGQRAVLRRNNSQLQMECTCRPSDSEATCKHVWAALVAAEKEGLISPNAAPGSLPPFRAAVLEPQREHPPQSLDRSTDQPAWLPPLRPAREWEARIEELRGLLNENASGSLGEASQTQVWYAVDAEKSQQLRRVVLRLYQRRRQRDGRWSNWRNLRLAVDQVGQLDDQLDRFVLSCLSAFPVDVKRDSKLLSNQVAVSYELARLILPKVCEAGRCVLLAADETPRGSLVWDDGPPWQLVAWLEYDEQDHSYSMAAALERNGQRLAINKVLAAVPGGLLVTEDMLALLEPGADVWLAALNAGRPIKIAEEDVEEFLEQFLGLASVPRLKLPERLRLQEVTLEPQPRLLLTTPQHWSWRPQRVMGSVYFDYGGHLVSSVSTQGAVIDRPNRLLVRRNKEQEQKRLQELYKVGFNRTRGYPRPDVCVELPIGDVGNAVGELLEKGWSVEADGSQVRQPRSMRLRVRSGIDWFELHGEPDFGGPGVPFPELLSALARGETAVKLDDGSLAVLPDQWRRDYSLLAELGTVEGDHLRFRTDQVGLLDVLLAAVEQEQVDFDTRFEQLRQKIRSFQGIQPQEEPEGFVGKLRDYQKEGLGWLKFLQDFQLGGCLADDMGLGKTIQVLALLQDRKNTVKRKRRPSLVVVPKSLLFNWRREAARFTPQLKLLEYTGPDRRSLRKEFRNHDVVLTTYGTLRREVLELKDIEFDYVVLDEAQTIKNPRAQIAKAVRLLKAEHRLALSGTPIENHITDLWSIFEFLNPGMLGRSSILRLATNLEEDASGLELLRRGLKPFILRRTKDQVASYLPEKSEQTVYCEMDEEQRRLYEEMRDHYRSSLLSLVSRQGLARSTMHVLEALLRLRQAACHPGLLDPSRQDEPSAKVEVLCHSLEQVIEEGHKALVFSQFTSMLAILRRHLDRRGIEYAYLDGSTRKRDEVVDRFQSDPECPVFLISLKAGGFGLNLTAADYVFLFDPWWNPAVENQAIDRTHRIGQTKKVFAYRLICRDTVEEKIEELQARKKDLAKALLHEDGSLLRNLTPDDLELLLS